MLSLIPLMAPPASATIVGGSIEEGENITVFHNLDFIAAFYPVDRIGEPTTVDVIRDGVTIGSTAGELVGAEPDEDGNFTAAALEVNHGPEGEPQPGDCWVGNTPDIRPGDHIVITQGTDIDEVIVDNIQFTDPAPVVHPATATTPEMITVSGIALRANGDPIPVEFLDSAGFLETAQLRGSPDRVEAIPGVPGGFRSVFEAPYTNNFSDPLGRDVDGVGEAGMRQALLGDGWDMGFGHVDPLPLESMLVEGISDVPSPALGCEGSPAIQWSVTQAPTINSLTGAYTISGIADNTDSVVGHLSDGTTTINSTSETLTGNQWTATFDAADVDSLLDGTLTASATYTLAAGDISGRTKSVHKDTAIPGAPTNLVGPANVSNDTTPSWSFDGENGATFQCQLMKGATEVSAFSACESPKTYAALTAGDGDYTFNVRQIDAAGNPGTAVATDSYALDTAPPAAPSITDLKVATNDTTPTWSFTGEAGATFDCRVYQVSLGAGSASFAPCNSGSFTAATLAQSASEAYRFEVRQTDEATNQGGTASDDFILDTVAPNAPSISGTALVSNDTSPSWDLDGAEDGGQLQCSFGLASAADSFSNCGAVFSQSDLAEGNYMLKVHQMDDAGNTGAVATRAYELDLTAPAAAERPNMTALTDSGRSRFDNVTNVAQPRFTGLTEAGATVELMSGDDVIGTGIADDTGRYSILSDPLADGDYSLTVLVTDDAGNAAEADSPALDVTIDSASPGINGPTASPARLNLNRVEFTTIRARADEANRMKIEIRNLLGRTVKTYKGRNLEATELHDVIWRGQNDNGRLLIEGRYVIRAMSTDHAGNSSVERTSIRLIR